MFYYSAKSMLITVTDNRNCPKYVDFYSKNKFEKLVRLVGFIIRTYPGARSLERHTHSSCQLLMKITSYGQVF